MDHDCPKDKASVVDGQYIEGCKLCINTVQKNSIYHRKYIRDRMKENHRKDMIQRYDGEDINPEWVKAYPEIARQDLGEAEMERILRK